MAPKGFKTTPQTGFALVESTIALVLATGAVAGLLTLLYFGFARVWISHAAYEAMICSASQQTVSQCQDDLRRDVARALPIGQLKQISLVRTRRKVKVQVHFEIATKLPIRERQSAALPLRRSP